MRSSEVTRLQRAAIQVPMCCGSTPFLNRHKIITRATQKQAQEYKEKKVQFFKDFVDNAEETGGSTRQKKHRHPVAAPASASDELLKVE